MFSFFLGKILTSGFIGSYGNSICLQKSRIVISRECQDLKPGDLFSGYGALCQVALAIREVVADRPYGDL